MTWFLATVTIADLDDNEYSLVPCESNNFSEAVNTLEKYYGDEMINLSVDWIGNNLPILMLSKEAKEEISNYEYY